MTQTVTEPETVEQAENRLWNEYMVAKARQQQAWLAYELAWREFVKTGLRDETREKAWKIAQDVEVLARECAESTKQEWKRIAYPLYDIPLLDEEDK